MKPMINRRGLLDIAKLVIFAALVVATTLSVSMRSGDAEAPETPEVSNQVFGSVEEAQDIVPFKIATLPSTPQGMVLTGVGVTKTEGNTRVDILYQDADGNAMQLIQDTMETNIHGPVSASSQADVNGIQAQVVTGSNVSGTQIGIVQWKSEGITYVLIASHTSGQSLVPLANKVQSE